MPSASARRTGLDLHADTSDFQRLFARSSEVEPKLRTGLRRNIRQVAGGAAKDSQRTVLREPLRPSAQPKHTGLRSGIASGINVAVLTGNTRIGVAIVASGSALPADQRSILRAYGRARGWRHPVFNNPNVWVTQFGRPYFYSIIAQHRDETTRAVTSAMVEAVASLEGL
jgi:hypothetical protein